MFKMSDRNKEILQLALEGVATPKEIATAYGVEVNHVYKLRHGHKLKIRNHEAKTQKLREMVKLKTPAEVRAEAKAEIKRPPMMKGRLGEIQKKQKALGMMDIETWEKAKSPPVGYRNMDELQQIAATARDLYAISEAQKAARTPPEDYFERLKSAQAEIDRLNKESVDQKREVKELLAQNGMLMRIISKRA